MHCLLRRRSSQNKRPACNYASEIGADLFASKERSQPLTSSRASLSDRPPGCFVKADLPSHCSRRARGAASVQAPSHHPTPPRERRAPRCQMPVPPSRQLCERCACPSPAARPALPSLGPLREAPPVRARQALQRPALLGLVTASWRWERGVSPHVTPALSPGAFPSRAGCVCVWCGAVWCVRVGRRRVCQRARASPRHAAHAKRGGSAVAAAAAASRLLGCGGRRLAGMPLFKGASPAVRGRREGRPFFGPMTFCLADLFPA